MPRTRTARLGEAPQSPEWYAEHALRLGIRYAADDDPIWYRCHDSVCPNVIPAKLIENATPSHLPEYCTPQCRMAEKARRNYRRRHPKKGIA